MTQDNQQQPMSYAAKRVMDMLQEGAKELDGLTTVQVQALVVAVQEYWGFENSSIHVFYKNTPKEIVIFPKDANHKRIRMKDKNPDFLNEVRRFLNLSDIYVLRFAKPDESEPQEPKEV